MVLKKLNQNIFIDFLSGAVDLKKNVFINLRKQARQKMEGIRAS
jgi:uncharacterized membrane protein YvbJ